MALSFTFSLSLSRVPTLDYLQISHRRQAYRLSFHPPPYSRFTVPRAVSGIWPFFINAPAKQFDMVPAYRRKHSPPLSEKGNRFFRFPLAVDTI